MNDLCEIVSGLRAHPDAAVATADGDPARARGFQELTVFNSGAISVLYHWGRRSFASVEELQNWLAGDVPRSWQ